MSPNASKTDAKVPDETNSCLEPDEEGHDDQDDDRPRNKYMDRIKRLGFQRKGLIILAVLLFLVLIFLIVIIALAATRCQAEPEPLPDVCTSSSCLRTSAVVLEGLNHSANPCDDFWEYACGGWIAGRTPISPKYGRESVVDTLVRNYMVQGREIIETLPYTSDFRSAPYKVKAFYKSCMDLESVDSNGDKDFNRRIEQLRGWKATNKWSENTWEWPKVLRDLHVEYGVFPFFQISVQRDEAAPGENIIQISPSGLALPHRNYYFRHPDNPVLVAYKLLMRELAIHLGATTQQANSFVDEVFHFEKRIAEVTPSFEEWDSIENQEKMIIQDLRQSAQRVDWIEHFKALLPKVQIYHTTHVVTPSRQYLTAVSTILSTTDKGPLNNYLIWTLIYKYAPYLSKEYRFSYDQFQRVLTGATESKPRWEFCMEETNKVFNVALLSKFVQTKIPEGVFNATTEIYKAVKKSFINHLENVDWLDKPSKHLAVEMANKLQDHSKNFVLGDKDLDSYYDNMMVSKMDFFHNILDSVAFRKAQLEMLIQDGSKEQLEKPSLLTLQPYFISTSKQIVIPPVLLQPPIFQADFPLSLEFGALGFLVAHEVVHAFDELGKMFNRDGYSTNFWNNVTVQKFFKHKECIALHYSNYKINNMQANVYTTLRNNIADIGGIIQAFRAYKELSKTREEPSLLGVDLNHDKLFFVSFAQSMCSEARPEQLETSIELDDTAPNKIRVMASLAQVPQFAETFQCEKMPSHSYCRLW